MDFYADCSCRSEDTYARYYLKILQVAKNFYMKKDYCNN